MGGHFRLVILLDTTVEGLYYASVELAPMSTLIDNLISLSAPIIQIRTITVEKFWNIKSMDMKPDAAVVCHNFQFLLPYSLSDCIIIASVFGNFLNNAIVV